MPLNLSYMSVSKQLRDRIIACMSLDGDVDDEPWCELDSHADTCVAGANCAPMGPVGPCVNVHAFAPGYGAKTYHIRTAATVWTDESDGNEYLLVFHQSIFLGDDLQHTLVNPNQLRHNGITVQDCPKQFDRNSQHCIQVPGKGLKIPLQMRGVISGFHSRLPTQEELESLPQIELTRDIWNPKSDNFAAAEEAARRRISAMQAQDHDDAEARYISAAAASDIPPDMLDSDDGDKENLYTRLVSSVIVPYEREPLQVADVNAPPGDELEYQVDAVISSRRKPKVTPEELSQKWCIGLDTAKKTLASTTQSGMRNIFVPSDRKV